MGNGKTQHEKLDDLLEITTDIRIEQGKMEVQVGTLKEEQDKLRNWSNEFDGIIAFGTVVVLYIQSKVKLP